ncbi:MAG TPA: nucleoside transporter C-terminal domain-containing protein [Candidatus Hydrogenedentes bacterium]|nr:nucleoside transporter C-terminal domain-containing protein [Candidatus Hydrogenedentota bacterium]HPG68480.1 nucleoside transporter C-terminal domain-containing protein [Candidatus Hydrogenedentota bacterium]
MALRLVSLFGLLAMVALAWALSENRRKADWRLVIWGIGLQFALGLLVLRTVVGRRVFDLAKAGFDVVTAASAEGARFLFGNLTQFFILSKDAVLTSDQDFVISAVVAFQVLPVIIFVSSLAGILFHLGIIQRVVRFMAWGMRRTLKTSGAETFSAALLVFLGIESMTAVRAYLRTMTRSELCTVMTAFLATIAASVMVAYAGFGAEPGHLLSASLMSAPAAILIAKLLVPETEEPKTRGDVRIEVPIECHNIVDAAARGASEGLMMALNVGAMLIAFIGLVYLADQALGAVTGLTFTQVMGWVFRPFAAIMGVPLHDVAAVSQLLATKTVLNEFLAYSDLKPLIDTGAISPRSITIATYALCGFANPGSVGIVIGGLSGLVPERRSEIAALGLRAFIGGTLACFMTACVAGMLA